MDKIRLMVIINNLLVEILKTADMSNEEYLSWLKTEVGVSKAEIDQLKESGLFPGACY